MRGMPALVQRCLLHHWWLKGQGGHTAWRCMDCATNSCRPWRGPLRLHGRSWVAELKQLWLHVQHTVPGKCPADLLQASAVQG